jgi:hypothetical protein
MFCRVSCRRACFNPAVAVMGALSSRTSNGTDGEQRPRTVQAVGQFQLHELAQACQGLLDGAVVGAQPAQFQAAGGEPTVTVWDDGGLVVQDPPWLACWRDHLALLASGGGAFRLPGSRLLIYP